MNQTKPAWQSKGVWGGIIVIILAVSQLWQLQTGQILVSEIELKDVATSIGTIFAAVLAIYGRIKATKQIN